MPFAPAPFRTAPDEPVQDRVCLLPPGMVVTPVSLLWAG